jgi:hypothetical protein
MPDPRTDSDREHIHLPGPTVLPLATAVGITIALVGLPFSFWFVAAGLVIVLICAVRWIATVREEIESLPTERR